MRALAEAAWIHAITPRRLRSTKPVVCIGGSRLGGTGKTPLAIAVAQYLAPRVRVAIVGHAYRAKPGRARVVSTNDPLDEVGDEALVCARHATTVVGPTRQAALDLACSLADVVVLDGVLQLAPHRAALAVLTGEPSWLERHADVRVAVQGEIDVSGLDGRRVGLVTCLARPERIVRALETRGIHVAVHRAFRNHGPPRVAGRPKEEVDVWVASEKCAQHLPGAGIHVLAYRAALPPAVRARLDRLAPSPYSEIPRT